MRGPSGTIWSTELKQSRKAQSAGQSRKSRRQRKGEGRRKREREKRKPLRIIFCNVAITSCPFLCRMSCSHSDMDVNMDSKSAASSRCCLPLKYLTLFANCPLPLVRCPFACCRQMLLPKIHIHAHPTRTHTHTHFDKCCCPPDSTDSANCHAMRTETTTIKHFLRLSSIRSRLSYRVYL